MAAKASKRAYLDYASATPMTRAARTAFVTALSLFGNPSAVHREALRAKEALTQARVDIARSLSVKPDEIVFTSGGTESNNLAIMGVVRALRARGVSYRAMHCITSSIEHASTLAAFAMLETDGVEVSYVQPESDGIVRPTAVLEAIRPETVLISLAHVNSEMGTVQPLSELGSDIRTLRRTFESSHHEAAPGAPFPILHADAAQSPLYLDPGPHVLRADLVSYDAQKVGGPKGVGVLFRDYAVPLAAIVGGGTQERSVRPGTENVPGAVSAAAAFTEAGKNRKRLTEKVAALQSYFLERITHEIPTMSLVGSKKRRIANNLFFVVPGIDGDYLAVLMDKEGVSVSPRSACVGSGGGESHVIRAVLPNAHLASSSIRFTLGPQTKKADLDLALKALKKCIPLAIANT